MLRGKGASCTEQDIGKLGEKYTNFISSSRPEEQTGEEDSAKQGNVDGNKEGMETETKLEGNVPPLFQDSDPLLFEIDEIPIEQKHQIIPQLDEQSLAQQQFVLELQKKYSEIEQILKEKECTIQEKEAAIREREAIIQQNDAVMQRIAEETREKENEAASMRKTKRKWREVSPEIEEIFKSNFFTSTKNEHWQFPEDFEIIESISEGRGAFNVGVFRVSSRIGDCAIKIIERMVEDTPENVQPMYNTLQIRKLDQAETSIPFAFAFPTMVPLLNFFIGDLKGLNHPAILHKKQLLEGTTARLINKTTFLVMPVYDGTLESFWSHVKQQTINISLEDEYFVIYQCLLTLEHFKVNRIIHGDFRPANIFIFYKATESTNFLRIGVGDFGLAKTSAKSLLYSKDLHGNPFNNYYVPPEVRRYRPTPNTIENFWDVFKGYDCWSLGKSILELYCVSEREAGGFSAALQRESLKSKEEFHAWFNDFVGERMTEQMKQVCLLMLDLDKNKRNVGDCLMILGVQIWVVPELRSKLGNDWQKEEMKKKKQVVVALFDSVADSFSESLAMNSKMENWREVSRIHWFSKNRVMEDIFEFI